MPGYLIALVDVKDWEQYRMYTAATPALIARFGGRFRIRGGTTTTVEGPEELRRIVVIEFPSYDQALRFYDSPEYSELKKLRADAADGQFLIVEGVTES